MGSSLNADDSAFGNEFNSVEKLDPVSGLEISPNEENTGNKLCNLKSADHNPLTKLHVPYFFLFVYECI
jgi:hypothetical protein